MEVMGAAASGNEIENLWRMQKIKEAKKIDSSWLMIQWKNVEAHK